MENIDKILFLIGVIVLVLVFINYVIRGSKNHKQKEYERELEIEQRINLQLISEGRARSTINYIQITPEIVEVYYDNTSEYKFTCDGWRSIKKNKLSYFDEDEEVFLLQCDRHKQILLDYTSPDKVCVQWHKTMRSKTMDDIGSSFHLCTIYIGQGAIEALEDEIEMKKIEERLRKAQRKKILEEIVKERMQDDDY